MKLSVREIAKELDILQPRYHDNVVLLAKYKIDKLGGHNIIHIKKGAYSGDWYIDNKTVYKYPFESNGKIQCYAVPLDELKIYEGREKD